MNNLTQAYDVFENKITNLTAENKNLSKQNQELNTQNQELEADRKNLTEKIQTIEAKQVEFNISRAQWSIDAYCPKENNARTCKQCEKGWIHSQSSCYAVNNPERAERRSWEGAREDCRGKGSDLVVVGDNPEKKTVSDYSWGSSGWNGFWIGLKAENGKWKWIDGSDLADKHLFSSWMLYYAQDGRCVISVQNEGWKSVSCDEKHQWICEKAALSV
ncbi:killer cell lectin-like receptor subfamily G member 1 [Odontesthes bonariensis]